MNDFVLKILLTGLLSASPIGELLVAYPFGIAIGLDPFTSIVVSFIFNILPILALLLLLNKLSNLFPRFFKWLENRSFFYNKYFKKIGIIAFLVFTPIIGVYATTIFLRLLGQNNILSFAIQTLSLSIYSVILYTGTYFIILTY